MSRHSLSAKLSPTVPEAVARAQSDLKLGLPVQMVFEGARGLLLAVETLNEARLEALCENFAAPELVLTANRARAVLPATNLADMRDDPVRIQAPAYAPPDWYRRLADTTFDNTGPRGPLHLVRGASTPMHRFAVSLVKSAELLPAAVFFPVLGDALDAAGLNLPDLSVTAAFAHLDATPQFASVASSLLPIEVHDAGRLHVFRDPDGPTEHYALEVGEPDRNRPVLCRVHSACFTGDVLGSLKCDCGAQLRAALSRMGQEGSGILLYLNQEGRGIGLANKMRVYGLQAQGFDTVEANHRLGFEDDERDFRIATGILRSMGVEAVRLLTNNPAKVDTVGAQGLTVVERVPLKVGKTPQNENYLAVKALKSGHFL